jgi:hypothetical protein
MLLRYELRKERKVDDFWWVDIQKVVGLWSQKSSALDVVPGDGTDVWGKIHMNRGRVGEERRGKEMDGCPLTPQASYPRVDQSRLKVSEAYWSSYRKANDTLHIQSWWHFTYTKSMSCQLVTLHSTADMAHTVSINGIFTLIQYNSEIDQDSAVSMYFSRLFKSLALNN